MVRRRSRKRSRSRFLSGKYGRFASLVVKVLSVLFLVVFIWLSVGMLFSRVKVGGRFSFVIVDGDRVLFVSTDSIERVVDVIVLPSDLEIRSNSTGTYRVGGLYGLGKYDGMPGLFLSRKVQGFLRLPVNGYVVSNGAVKNDGSISDYVRKVLFRSVFSRESNISVADRVLLSARAVKYVWRVWDSDELVRLGVFKKSKDGKMGYDSERLFAYTKDRFFDWLIANENLSVAVLDVSGMGFYDTVSEFLENLGLDVVGTTVVKDDSKFKDKTEIVVSDKGLLDSKSVVLLRKFFSVGKDSVRVGDIDQYRSDILFVIGRDVDSMF